MDILHFRNMVNGSTVAEEARLPVLNGILPIYPSTGAVIVV